MAFSARDILEEFVETGVLADTQSMEANQYGAYLWRREYHRTMAELWRSNPANREHKRLYMIDYARRPEVVEARREYQRARLKDPVGKARVREVQKAYEARKRLKEGRTLQIQVRMTPEQKARILALRAQGNGYKKIGILVGVSRSTVRDLIWKVEGKCRKAS